MAASSGYGYGNVDDKGYIAIEGELSQGVWGAVPVKKVDAEDEVAKVSLLDTPLVVVWKVRLLWVLRALVKALGVDPLGKLDVEWDSAQRALAFFLNYAAEHQDPAVKEAAARLQISLLQDGGTGQTQLSYDEEVDFGLKQAKLAGVSPHAEDLKKVGAGHHIDRIKAATEALSKGMGRTTGQNRAPARARRVREALSACTSAFNAVHEGLDWAIEHTESGEERDRLEALRAPLVALLARYPAPAAAPAAETPPSAPPAAGTGG